MRQHESESHSGSVGGALPSFKSVRTQRSVNGIPLFQIDDAGLTPDHEKKEADMSKTEDGIEDPADTAKVNVVKLPAHLDLSAGEEIAEALEHLRGLPVEIQADEVSHLGGIFLQLLIGAQKQWLKDEAPFSLTAPSAAFQKGMALLGAPESLFEEGKAA